MDKLDSIAGSSGLGAEHYRTPNEREELRIRCQLDPGEFQMCLGAKRDPFLFEPSFIHVPRVSSGFSKPLLALPLGRFRQSGGSPKRALRYCLEASRLFRFTYDALEKVNGFAEGLFVDVITCVMFCEKRPLLSVGSPQSFQILSLPFNSLSLGICCTAVCNFTEA